MAEYIYALCDPRFPEVIRYVGYTKYVPTYRLSRHLTEAKSGKSSHKNNWIRKLIKENVQPVVKIIEKVNKNNWQEREKFWISFYKETLTNSTDGGEGVINPSPETLNKRRLKMEGSRFITNGTKVKQLKEDEELPEGWMFGIKDYQTRSVHADSLMFNTMELLNQVHLEKVSQETGLPLNWLRKFKYGTYKDPSVNRIQFLYEYLTGKQLISK